MCRLKLPLLAAAWFSLACAAAEPKAIDGSSIDGAGDSTSEAEAVSVSSPGEPLPHLNASEQQAFGAGLAVFSTEFTPDNGLGPLFNAPACGECHENPAAGGFGDEVEVHQSDFLAGSSCKTLDAMGGPVVQQHTTPLLLAATGGKTLEDPIPGATATGLRKSPLIFGMGLIDAVPDQLIKLLARIRYRDGVHGRAAVLPNGRVGRFSRKATTASLEEFNAGAYFNEMGITNRFNPVEGTFAGVPFDPLVDPAPEPEIDATSLAASDMYVKLLGPVAPSPLSSETRFGRFLFYKIGCAECHIPLLRTGNSPIQALRQRWFRAYTDLLLHDLGQENADICNGVATPSEFRTQPLMGMQFLDGFMHDGASVTIQQAIERHGGEGSASRAKFLGLATDQQAALVAFVQGL
jgi:CxxC motif-containing protein (DUF1111 family)